MTFFDEWKFFSRIYFYLFMPKELQKLEQLRNLHINLLKGLFQSFNFEVQEKLTNCFLNDILCWPFARLLAHLILYDIPYKS